MTIINTTEIQDIDLASLEFELEKQPAPKAKKQYVDNKALYQEFVKYHEKKKEWIANGCPGRRPPLTDKIGQAIMDIAQRRCYSRNFINYTDSWKEEMISDAIETCVMYGHNFNPEKYDNPFAYLTQLVSNAIINRLKKEKKQVYIKYKAFDELGGFAAVSEEYSSGDNQEAMGEINEMYADHLRYIADYEEKMRAAKEGDEENALPEPKGVLEFAS